MMIMPLPPPVSLSQCPDPGQETIQILPNPHKTRPKHPSRRARLLREGHPPVGPRRRVDLHYPVSQEALVVRFLLVTKGTKERARYRCEIIPLALITRCQGTLSEW